MIKARVVSATMSVVGVVMIVVALVIEDGTATTVTRALMSKTDKANVVNMSLANRVVKTKIESNEEEVVEEVKTTKKDDKKEQKVEEVSMEQAPQAEYIPPRVEVYEGMTMEELSEKLNRSLGNGVIGGKGSVIASKCIELGVDPYVATAIMLHETGCKYRCSNLTVTCNNVGGQKGSPACNGSYKGYSTIEEGIIGHIENLSRYYSQGLTTVEAIGPRYAESPTWSSKINWYIETIRSS